MASLCVVLGSHRTVTDLMKPAETGLVPKNMIIRQQLQEAEVIVLSKRDLVTPKEMQSVRAFVQAQASEVIDRVQRRRPS